MKKKVLKLTLKKMWYDLILLGVKQEEYREIKEYWLKRLFDVQSPMIAKFVFGNVGLTPKYSRMSNFVSAIKRTLQPWSFR